MYFKEHLPILTRDDLCNLPECLVTEIRMEKKKCFFTSLYRSPAQSSDEFDTLCSNLNLFLSNINDLNPASSVVISDSNARNSKWWSSDTETFERRTIHSLTTSAGYTQLIDQPMHVIPNSSSCIDLIFASNPNVICNSGIELCLFNKFHHNLISEELNFIIPNAECIWRSISIVDWNFLFQATSVNREVMIFNKYLRIIFHNFILNKLIICIHK